MAAEGTGAKQWIPREELSLAGVGRSVRPLRPSEDAMSFHSRKPRSC